jgi:sialidase-1
MTEVIEQGKPGAIALNLQTGIVYRNPTPHLKSIHAYFPSVAAAADGRLFAVFTTAEAFEALNLRVHLSVSSDGGESWAMLTDPAPLPTDSPFSETARLTITKDEELVLLLVRHSRKDHMDCGFVNPVNLGFVPTQFFITRSRDWGRSWSELAAVSPPLEGPEFEMCSPIVELRDGRWLLPTSTWRDWNGRLPNGNRAVAFISHDRGRTWPEYLDVMHHQSDRVRYWESKIVEQADSSLVAVAWAYDEPADSDLPNQYVVSRDGGTTWTAPRSAALNGQTMAALTLGDGRILAAYRRKDRPGLWLNISRLDGDQWVNDTSQALWGSDSSGSGRGSHMTQRFQTLRFGAPSMTHCPDGRVVLAFWCYEDCISVIRWYSFYLGHKLSGTLERLASTIS